MTTATRPQLTPEKLDKMMVPPRPRTRIIWTAEAIAAQIGTSADYVRHTLVNLEGSPVKKMGTRYCAHADDLEAFFRARPIQT